MTDRGKPKKLGEKPAPVLFCPPEPRMKYANLVIFIESVVRNAQTQNWHLE
jgi:hypothetical protein